MEKDEFSHIENMVKKIITDVLCVEKDKVKGGSLLKKDLGADYLDIAVIKMNLEDAFGIVIPDKGLAGKNKVSEIIDYIKGRKRNAAIPRETYK